MIEKKIQSKAKVEVNFTITFTLTPTEASALEAIAGYGHEVFLKKFYTKVGKAYLQPHEKGLISLFKRIKEELPMELYKVEQADEAINNALKNI